MTLTSHSHASVGVPSGMVPETSSSCPTPSIVALTVGAEGAARGEKTVTVEEGRGVVVWGTGGRELSVTLSSKL